VRCAKEYNGTFVHHLVEVEAVRAQKSKRVRMAHDCRAPRPDNQVEGGYTKMKFVS